MTIKAGVTLIVSGTYNIHANITVESGGVFLVSGFGHLNIQPGSTLSFANNTGITIYGQLNANGATFQSIGSGTWGSLSFYGYTEASSVLNNVTIKHGNGIQCLNWADVTIENSTFDACIQGIYIYNSQPSIINNIIDDPQQNGIYGAGAGLSPLIQGNTIKKITNPYNYQGIYFSSSTAPTITNNNISGFYFGAYLGGGCFTVAQGGQTQMCNNIITDNRVGVATTWGSCTYAGDQGCGGWNSIFGNTYDACTANYSYLSAYYNFWGENYHFYADGTSVNEIDILLTTDPCIGQDKSMQKDISDVSINNNLNKSGKENIFAGLLLEKQGKIDEAIDFYKRFISKNNNVKSALTKLAAIKNKYSRPEIMDYFENILSIHNQHYGIVEKLIGDIYIQNNRFDDAINAYNDVIKNSPTDYDGINARFGKLFAYLHVKEDPTTASQILSEIKGIKSEDAEVQIRIKIAENLIYGTNKVMRKNVNTAEVNIPKTYELFQNYPNPFNPETIIKYQIPKPGLVTLKVYDILGREVATLVNENKIEGFYDYAFNGSRFTSGVYIYQLRVNDYVSSKKMILLK